MTAQIIPFPKRPDPEHKSLVQLAWTGIEIGPQMCSEHIHYFTSKDAPCQCGCERWPARPT